MLSNIELNKYKIKLNEELSKDNFDDIMDAGAVFDLLKDGQPIMILDPTDEEDNQKYKILVSITFNIEISGLYQDTEDDDYDISVEIDYTDRSSIVFGLNLHDEYFSEIHTSDVCEATGLTGYDLRRIIENNMSSMVKELTPHIKSYVDKNPESYTADRWE